MGNSALLTTPMMPRPRSTFCATLLAFPWNAICRVDEAPGFPGCEVSNTDQLFPQDGLMIILETSISSLSFRSSELSQLSEVFSS